MQLPVRLRKRKSDLHKGDCGHVLVIGGSKGLTGAVCLSAETALKAGAGLVTAGIPRSLNDIFEIKLTEVMSLPLADNKGSLSLKAFEQIKRFLNKIDVIVLGPGASRLKDTENLIIKIIKEIDKPMVIDADALNALADNLDVLDIRKTKQIVLTPHLGEFSRLINTEKEAIKKIKRELVKEFALRYNLILVLKGHATLVTDGKKIYKNCTGNPGMATAGTGDVLCGMIAGVISQGVHCLEAAKFGVYLHGLCGDLAAKKKTETCLLASDLIECLPEAVKKARKFLPA